MTGLRGTVAMPKVLLFRAFVRVKALKTYSLYQYIRQESDEYVMRTLCMYIYIYYIYIYLSVCACICKKKKFSVDKTLPC